MENTLPLTISRIMSWLSTLLISDIIKHKKLAISIQPYLKSFGNIDQQWSNQNNSLLMDIWITHSSMNYHWTVIHQIDIDNINS